MAPTITVAGSYAVGLTMYTKRFALPGQTVLGRNFKTLHGGKGSNQAIAVSRLGGKAVFIARVGADDYGTEAVKMLRSEKVDVTHVLTDSEYATGVGFVIVDDSGDNEIVIDFGANRALSKLDIRAAEAQIAASEALLVQLEVGANAVEEAIRIADAHRVKVILNPAPYQPLSREILSIVDFVTPNETEATELLEMCGTPASGLTSTELAEALQKALGCIVVLTMGSSGACICDGNNTRISEAFTVSAVDSTGAGDTFSAAFAVAIAEGRELLEAARFANAAAALSVTKEGVVPSIPTREQTETWMASHTKSEDNGG